MTFNKSFLAALSLHLVVILCWIAYTFYQPLIFEEFKLAEYKENYLYIQNILLLIVPVIAGILADIFFANRGKVLLFFLISISLTACIFWASASVFLFSIAKTFHLIPIMMALWIIGMNLFYIPGLGLINESAEQTGVQRASAMIGAGTDIMMAITAPLTLLFQFLGNVVTFFVGGLLLVLVAYFYFKNSPDTRQHTETVNKEFPFLKLLFGLIAGIAVGIIEYIFIPQIHLNLFHWDENVWIPLALIAAAIALIYGEEHLQAKHTVPFFIAGFALCLFAWGSNLLFPKNIFSNLLVLLFLGLGIAGSSGTCFAFVLQSENRNWTNTLIGTFFLGFQLSNLLSMLG